MSELAVVCFLRVGDKGGMASQAHQPDEHVDLADVYQAARVYALTAYRWMHSA